MVKRGGLKRKIPINQITVKTSLGPTCNKRREGLFSKASQLCLLSGGQIAVLATPPSSRSHVSLHSFGHSSVNSVISAFLSGQVPQQMTEEEEDDDDRLGFSWNYENLLSSEDPKEIGDAIASMKTLLNELRAQEAYSYEENLNNNDETTTTTTTTTTHVVLPSSPICCIPHDQSTTPIEELIDFNTPFESFFDDWISENDSHQLLEHTAASPVTTNSDPSLDPNLPSTTTCCIDDQSNDLPAGLTEITDEQLQILCAGYNNTETDQYVDFDPEELNLDFEYLDDIDQLWFSDNNTLHV